MKNYIKSPFNYTGGKYKQLNQLLSYFPKGITHFVDLFGGGFNVGLNVASKRVSYNDTVTPLVDLWKYFYTHDVDDMLDYINATIVEYNLSDNNPLTFKVFRNIYNTSSYRNPLDLYVLICFSYNYQLRFNNNYEYNGSHGTNRSKFNSNLEKRFKSSISRLREKEVSFTNQHFTKYKNISHNSFVYCDPPYLLSTASYNDGQRGYGGWNIKEEKQLYKYLTKLNENNILFGLSNILRKNNTTNNYLNDFINENNLVVHEIKSNYDNCSYNKMKSKTVEVYVTNI